MKRPLIYLLIWTFLLATIQPVKAEISLPKPGIMVNLSPGFDPVMIKGMTVHPENPLLFDFLVSSGSQKPKDLNQQSNTLIKYFLACLAIPEEDLWVNLSPYEKNHMIPESLAKTELGRDLLAQDYILKQLTASLIYPEGDLGKEFWNRVYTKAKELYGVSQLPVNTFNKVWILADSAKIYEHDNTAFVVHSHLKVMLDVDYNARKNNAKASAQTIDSQIIRELILPEIEHEINTGTNFATIRQIFHAFILASWYKKNLKKALLNHVYANQSKVNGLSVVGTQTPEVIYQNYLQAYKKGVFNYIKNEYDATRNQPRPRKYFSGGTKLSFKEVKIENNPGKLTLENIDQIGSVDYSVTARMKKLDKYKWASPPFWDERAFYKAYSEVLSISTDQVVLTYLQEAPDKPALLEAAVQEQLKNLSYLAQKIYTDKDGQTFAALNAEKIKRYIRNKKYLTLKTSKRLVFPGFVSQEIFKFKPSLAFKISSSDLVFNNRGEQLHTIPMNIGKMFVYRLNFMDDSSISFLSSKSSPYLGEVGTSDLAMDFSMISQVSNDDYFKMKNGDQDKEIEQPESFKGLEDQYEIFKIMLEDYQELKNKNANLFAKHQWLLKYEELMKDVFRMHGKILGFIPEYGFFIVPLDRTLNKEMKDYLLHHTFDLAESKMLNEDIPSSENSATIRKNYGFLIGFDPRQGLMYLNLVPAHESISDTFNASTHIEFKGDHQTSVERLISQLLLVVRDIKQKLSEGTVTYDEVRYGYFNPPFSDFDPLLKPTKHRLADLFVTLIDNPSIQEQFILLTTGIEMRPGYLVPNFTKTQEKILPNLEKVLEAARGYLSQHDKEEIIFEDMLKSLPTRSVLNRMILSRVLRVLENDPEIHMTIDNSLQKMEMKKQMEEESASSITQAMYSFVSYQVNQTGKEESVQKFLSSIQKEKGAIDMFLVLICIVYNNAEFISKLSKLITALEKSTHPKAIEMKSKLTRVLKMMLSVRQRKVHPDDLINKNDEYMGEALTFLQKARDLNMIDPYHIDKFIHFFEDAGSIFPEDKALVGKASESLTKGGIDLNTKDLNLEIESKEVSVGTSQDLKNAFSDITGVIPSIIDIKPIKGAFNSLQLASK